MTTQRDLDAFLAKHIFGWHDVSIGPDVYDLNAGIVLVPPTVDSLADMPGEPPVRGKVARSYYCPDYLDELQARSLATFWRDEKPKNPLSFRRFDNWCQYVKETTAICVALRLALGMTPTPPMEQST